LRTFVVVTALSLIALLAQLLGASVVPVLFSLAAAWLILVSIGCAIYISGYAIYLLNKQHDNLHVPVGAASKKAASPEP
jgi:glucan phosphoethanolaminetransferase (alkaline phosphatase superfamily)